MKRTSFKQLKNDFTIFPFPSLGKPTANDFEFEIYTTKFEKFIVAVKHTPKLIASLKVRIKKTFTDPEQLAASSSQRTATLYLYAHAAKQSFGKAKKSFNQSLRSIIESYNKNKLEGVLEGAFALVLLALVIAILPLIVLYFFFRMLPSIVNIVRALRHIAFAPKNAAAHVSGFAKNQVFVHQTTNDEIRQERLISHEHCHLMQYHYHDVCDENKAIMNKTVDLQYLCPQTAENSRDITEPDYYLFDKDELEVRVHEAVRVIYYKNGCIPTSRKDFNKHISELLIDYKQIRLNRYKQKLEPISLLGNDLESLYSWIMLYTYNEVKQDEDMTIAQLEQYNSLWEKRQNQFIDELLFPCYINLVRYYGYAKLADQLGAEIMWPNLYNVTYKSNR